MHIGLRHTYYQAMISSGIGIMVLTAYVSTRSELAPIIQAPFDLFVVTFSVLTVIGGLITRSHCIRLNEDVKEGRYITASLKLIKSGKFNTTYYAKFIPPICLVKSEAADHNGDSDDSDDLKNDIEDDDDDDGYHSIKLEAKKTNKKLFDGKLITAEVVIDQNKDFPIAIHFEEQFIFAKLSTLSAMPVKMVSKKKLFQKRLGIVFISLVFLTSMLVISMQDICYLGTLLKLTKANPKEENKETEKLVNNIIYIGSKFPQYDARQLTSRVVAANYFAQEGKTDRALNELELAKKQSEKMMDPAIWKAYILLHSGITLLESARENEAQQQLEDCLNTLKGKGNTDLIVPIMGWWRYRETTPLSLEDQALLALAITYDTTNNTEKALNAYRKLAIERGQRKDWHGEELARIRLSGFYLRHQQPAKAEEESYKVIALVENGTKNNSAETGSELLRLGIWCFSHNELNCSELLLKEALKINEKTSTATERTIAINLNFLAETLKLEKKFDQAKPLFEKSLKILDKDKTDGEWTWPALSLEDIKMETADPSDSLEKLENIYKVRKQVFKKDDVRLACPQHSIGNYYLKQSKYQKAEQYLKNALEKRTEVLGDKHPQVLSTMQDYIRALKASGKEEEANTLEHSYQTLNTRPII